MYVTKSKNNNTKLRLGNLYNFGGVECWDETQETVLWSATVSEVFSYWIDISSFRQEASLRRLFHKLWSWVLDSLQNA